MSLVSSTSHDTPTCLPFPQVLWSAVVGDSQLWQHALGGEVFGGDSGNGAAGLSTSFMVMKWLHGKRNTEQTWFLEHSRLLKFGNEHPLMCVCVCALCVGWTATAKSFRSFRYNVIGSTRTTDPPSGMSWHRFLGTQEDSTPQAQLNIIHNLGPSLLMIIIYVWVCLCVCVCVSVCVCVCVSVCVHLKLHIHDIQFFCGLYSLALKMTTNKKKCLKLLLFSSYYHIIP